MCNRYLKNRLKKVMFLSPRGHNYYVFFCKLALVVNMIFVTKKGPGVEKIDQMLIF